MSEEQNAGKMPEYTGNAEFIKDGIQMNVKVAIWINKDKNGKTYLALNFGGIKSHLFKFEPKPKAAFKEELI